MATLDPWRCTWRLPTLLSPPDAEKTPGYWNKGARRRLELALALQPAAQRAKNIILFMGDGECPGTWLMRRWGWGKQAVPGEGRAVPGPSPAATQ